jgi:hypothetical protein
MITPMNQVQKALRLGACKCINKTSMISELIFTLKENIYKQQINQSDV